MPEYAKNRFFKLVDHICQMELPFNDLVAESICKLKNDFPEQVFLNKSPVFLLQLLVTVESYIHYAVNEYRDLMCALAGILENKKKKEMITRFYQYRELQKDNFSDKQIFEKMYQVQANKDKEPFHRYYDRMRKWKNDHAHLLQENPDLIVHNNNLRLFHNLGNDIADHDIAYFLEKLSQEGVQSGSKLGRLLQHWKTGRYQDDELFGYHFLSLIAVCVIRRARWASEIYDDYVTGLKEVSLLTALTQPKKSEVLRCIAEDKRQKNLNRPHKVDHQADIHRAMALTKTTPYYQDVYFSSINTFRRKYEQLLSEYHNIMSEKEIADENNEDVLVENCLIDILHRKRGFSRNRKIKKWADVLTLMEEYGLQRSVENADILKRIFTVCREKRDWILPDELELKQYFERLEYRDFFDTLHSRLDRRASIKALAGIRWHKIPAPEHKMKSPRELLEPREIYSPFWK